MRRFFNGLLVLCVVASLSVPTYAAPRRDDGGELQNPIMKIVQIIKRVIKKLDGGDMSFPKP
jgi:hypothetical protein